MTTPYLSASLTDALGIKFEEPFGRRSISVTANGYTKVEVGQVVVIDGMIHAVPHPALTRSESEILREYAEDVFFHPPRLNGEWSHSGGVGEPSRWTTYVSVVYLESDCPAVAPDFSLEG